MGAIFLQCKAKSMCEFLHSKNSLKLAIKNRLISVRVDKELAARFRELLQFPYR